MTDRDKVLKAFTQCSDALSNLEQNSILKVFHLLSVHYEIIPHVNDNYNMQSENNLTVTNLPHSELPKTIEETVKIITPKTTKNAQKSQSKKPKSNLKTPSVLPNLNLKPVNKTHLVNNYNEFKIKSDLVANLFFVYYLTKTLNEDSISVNHIMTCYKEVKRKVPINLYQSLANTKRDKSWLDTSNMENIRLTIQGENYIEHDLLKNENN